LLSSNREQTSSPKDQSSLTANSFTNEGLSTQALPYVTTSQTSNLGVSVVHGENIPQFLQQSKIESGNNALTSTRAAEEPTQLLPDSSLMSLKTTQEEPKSRRSLLEFFGRGKQKEPLSLVKQEPSIAKSSSSSNIVGVYYRVGKKIGENHRWLGFEGTNVLNNQKVSVLFVRLAFSRLPSWSAHFQKQEPRKAVDPQLQDEYRIYKSLVSCRKSRERPLHIFVLQYTMFFVYHNAIFRSVRSFFF
jgi:hypothetical protein